LGGYHKRYYLLFALVIGVFGIGGMLFTIKTPIVMVIFIFCIHMCISVCDLLAEASYARKMQEPAGAATGSSIVTLVLVYQNVGFLAALSFVGVLADYDLFRIAYVVSFFCVLSPIFPVIWAWLPERKRHLWEQGLQKTCFNNKTLLIDRARVMREWRIILLVGCTGFAGPLLGGITGFVPHGDVIGLGCAVTILVCIMIGAYKVFPRTIANVALYQVLAQVSQISVGSALDYFFTADATCLPDGPNFNYVFYVTWTGLIGCVISIATLIFYEKTLNGWRYRSVLIFTTILRAMGGLFDFVMTMRWNITYLHIPDRYFYILGDGVIHDIVDMLYWIPSSSIIAKVCPHGMEAAVFSFLAGISNYGRMVSTLSGAQLIKLSGIRTTGECYWGPLPWLVLFGHILLMLFVSLPAAWLIPNIYQTAPEPPPQQPHQPHQDEEFIEMLSPPNVEQWMDSSLEIDTL
jgi:MFS family permease